MITTNFTRFLGLLFSTIFIAGCAKFESTPSGKQTGLSVVACATPDNCVVHLSWTDNSSNETGFQVERAIGDASQEFTSIVKTAADVVAFEDRDVHVDGKYCYRVKAFNDTGESTYSDVACGVVTGSGPVQLKVGQ